jgi:hypothetical protein
MFEGKGGVCDTLSGSIRFRLENEANLTIIYHKLKYGMYEKFNIISNL